MWNDRDHALLMAGFTNLTKAIDKQTAVLERLAIAAEALGDKKEQSFHTYISKPHTKETTDE